MEDYYYKGRRTVYVVSDGVSTVKPQQERAVELVPTNNPYTGLPDNLEALSAMTLAETVELNTETEAI